MSYRINPKSKTGWIELITGCMFAGKTEEFIRRIKRYEYARQKVLVFKPEMDKRYAEKSVVSHSGIKVPAYSVSNSEQLLEVINKDHDFDVLAIDEVQFFDTNIISILDDFANQGKIIIVSGLDKDYRNDPFQNVDKLLYIAEYVDKLYAICFECGGNASRTQRIVNGVAAKLDEPLVQISGYDKYEARCRHCYIAPN
ncbi:thymidine kinase [Spiroplasma tabanidicola]|uniref:Thymidine kinase n=1 Tax=Spiroplasma tabanidicola TaxID=324079 RepID=A0A6I6CE68_9MOLU|nr:thymidine kinase [Spiroplasma tabanidicola]QGS52422.1 thymidine kinase [Spiroplasma tabanidicola]